jgi:ferredoxin
MMMDGLQVLETISNALEEGVPRVSPPLCTATRYRASTCRRCVDVCPAGAIEVAPWLRVDFERCRRCGACAAVCRTGALDLPAARAALRRGLAAVASHTDVLTFVCSRAGPYARGANPHITVPCLGGVSPADLVFAWRCAAREVVLVHADCAACELGRAAARVVREARTVIASFAGLGGDVTEVVTGAPAAAGAADQPRLPLSRRRLFATLAGGLGLALAQPEHTEKPRVEQLHEQRLPPAAHRALLHDLGSLAAQLDGRVQQLPAVLPVADVVVGPACDGCGLCARYCPHGAIAIVAGRPATDTTRCTACGLCAESCPRAALELLPGRVPASLTEL